MCFHSLKVKMLLKMLTIKFMSKAVKKMISGPSATKIYDDEITKLVTTHMDVRKHVFCRNAITFRPCSFLSLKVHNLIR